MSDTNKTKQPKTHNCCCYGVFSINRFLFRFNCFSSAPGRTSKFLGIDYGIPRGCLYRWILSTFYEFRASCMRIVIRWPQQHGTGIFSGQATAIIVFRTDSAQEADSHFYYNATCPLIRMKGQELYRGGQRQELNHLRPWTKFNREGRRQV